MFLGKHPFIYKDNRLGLSLRPKLCGDLFDQNNRITYNFLSTNKVILHNPFRKIPGMLKSRKLLLMAKSISEILYGEMML